MKMLINMFVFLVSWMLMTLGFTVMYGFLNFLDPYIGVEDLVSAAMTSVFIVLINWRKLKSFWMNGKS